MRAILKGNTMVNWLRFLSGDNNAAVSNLIIPFPADRNGEGGSFIPEITSGDGYYQIVFSSMYLDDTFILGDTYFPAFAYEITFNYGDNETRIHGVLSPETILNAGKANANRVFLHNIELTPRVPYNGGSITIKIGLLRMQGDAVLKRYLSTMEKLSKSLAVVPYLSTIVNAAPAVHEGIRELFGLNADQLILGYARTIQAQDMSQFLPTHVSLIDKSGIDFDQERLIIRDDRLAVRDNVLSPQDYVGSSHATIEIQASSRREDWRYVGSVEKYIREARTNIFTGDLKVANAALAAAIAEVITSPDLSETQQLEAAQLLRSDFDGWLKVATGEAKEGASDVDDSAAANVLPGFPIRSFDERFVVRNSDPDKTTSRQFSRASDLFR
jgi:hypothetical protein